MCMGRGGDQVLTAFFLCASPLTFRPAAGPALPALVAALAGVSRFLGKPGDSSVLPASCVFPCFQVDSGHSELSQVGHRGGVYRCRSKSEVLDRLTCQSSGVGGTVTCSSSSGVSVGESLEQQMEKNFMKWICANRRRGAAFIERKTRSLISFVEFETANHDQLSDSSTSPAFQ